MIDLNRSFPFRIQYIPAHRNIEGNELADLGAKAAHNSNYITPSPLSGRDFTRLVATSLNHLWQSKWLEKIQKTNKGKALYKVKNKLEYWPWTSHKNRLVESALARLRIGHVGLNQHLFRFKLSPTEHCLCGSIS